MLLAVYAKQEQACLCDGNCFLQQLGMLDNEEGQNLRHNKKIFFIIFAYFALNIFLKWAEKDSSNYHKTIERVQLGHPLSIDDLINVFDFEESHEGKWRRTADDNGLSADEGVFQMRLVKLVETRNYSYFDVVFHIVNGQFIDDGAIQYQFRCQHQLFQTTVVNGSQQLLSLKNSTLLDGKFDKDDIFLTKEIGPASANVFDVSFTVANKELQVEVQLETEQVKLSMLVGRSSDRLIKNAVFAAVLFLVSFGPFSALMAIIGDISEGRDSPSNYSLATVCLASMWDTVVCLVALVFAFSSQESLILFIIPAFLMCLIFTNLEPKLMILVFEAMADPANVRSLICRFNIIHYGSLLLVYPIIVLTNFNRLFFLLLSIIFLPQIYLNGINGTRPDPASKYYRHFLLYRFVLVFYVKCFPYNVFRFRPDFPLGVVCLCLLALQYSLIYLQKQYGPKKIMPRFMLPALYDYAYEEEVNLEEGGEEVECAICLTALHSDPPPSAVEFQSVSYRVMRTPCKHRYHSSCLVEWMRIKQDCPQCRAHLPPYE